MREAAGFSLAIVSNKLYLVRPLLIIVPFSTKSVPWYSPVDEIGTSVPLSRVPILCIRGFEQKGVPIWGDEIGTSTVPLIGTWILSDVF